MKRLAILAMVTCAMLSGQGNGQGVITTVAGSNWTFPPGVTVAVNAPLGNLTTIAVAGAGFLYVADSDNHGVFQIGENGSIRMVAGNGIQGFSGDGGPATSASLNTPYGVALDFVGNNLLIADGINSRIRKVSSSGIITTVAGNGNFGFSGDGGPATSASLNQPGAIAADGSGNFFIADIFNHRIRKVSASGIITTVAGNGNPGFSGDSGPAISASLAYPTGVAVDISGNLFIADTNNNRIRMVSASGIITTVAGNGNGGFSGDGGPATSASLYIPRGVVTDGSNLFIADGTNNRIRMVSASGIITTVAGNGIRAFSGDGGLATVASLDRPYGVAVDQFFNLFIADTSNNRIRKVLANGIITTIAGNGNFRFSGDGGPSTSALLLGPGGIAVDAPGNLFIADIVNNRIRKVSASGTITTVAGNGNPGFSGDGGPAASASLNSPRGIAVDTSGNLFIADAGNNRIRKVTAGTITTVAGNGIAGLSGDGGLATSASLGKLISVAVDASGNVFITDGNQIRKVSSRGIIATIAGTATSNLPCCNYFSGDGGPATSATLFAPQGVAVDASGNLLIVDTGNNRIRMVSASGIIMTVAGNGFLNFSGDGGPATSASLSGPIGIAADASGNLFIADSSNERIRKVSASGIITTAAGDGTYGFAGDGGPATSASLASPAGVAVDAASNLFIADTNNNRIREVLSGQNRPVVNANGIVNGASFSSQVVAPAEIVSAFGAGLGPSPGQAATASGGFLETLHAGVAVTFDGTAAPLFYVSSSQINLQVPWEVGTKTVTTVLVTANGQTGPPRALQLQATDPAIFVASGRLAIVNTAGAQITSSNPASAGAVLSIYATGLGAVDQPVKSGQLTPTGTLFNTLAATMVTVGGGNAPVSFAGLAPGFVGLYQVNFTVPSGLSVGDQPLVLSIGGRSTAPQPLAVR